MACNPVRVAQPFRKVRPISLDMDPSIYRLRQQDILTFCVLALLCLGAVMVQSASMNAKMLPSASATPRLRAIPGPGLLSCNNFAEGCFAKTDKGSCAEPLSTTITSKQARSSV